MKSYEVKFEIYGKKLKVTVEAQNEQHAKRIIKQDIVFHSVEEIEPVSDTVSDPEFLGDKKTFNHLMNIFNMKR